MSILLGCAPNPRANVVGHMFSQQICDWTETLRGEPVNCYPTATLDAAPGTLTGVVLHAGEPVADAAVLVAEPSGRSHAAYTDEDGRYRIQGIPPGQYTPAAVAPGFEETALEDRLGIPTLVTIRSNAVTNAPPIPLQPYVAPALPDPLAPAVQLTITDQYTATAPYPPGAAAQVTAFQFAYNDAVVDTLRLYVPLKLPSDAQLPLLFMDYPLNVDGWESVSVAFASQGYAVVALAPIGARGLDIEAHAQDARVALTLAQQGALSPHVADTPAVAVGGSFSSPILHRLLRSAGDQIAAWITVGGIANAFRTAANYYADRIQLPERYKYAVPAFGYPNVHPLPFLRYSPVYTVHELPPTMIIHTDADRIVLIEQAYAFEEALRAAGVPVEVFYYEDASHYLQIDENLTEAGKEMFERVLEFVERHQPQESED